MGERWRTGRKVGRTLYLQLADEPSDQDPIIGLMDTPELAARVVAAVNAKMGEVMTTDQDECAHPHGREWTADEEDDERCPWCGDPGCSCDG